MKSISLMLTVAICAGYARGNEDAPSNISFNNQDRLQGKLLSWDQDSLVWQSDILAQPARFLLKDISELTLPAQMDAPETPHTATITLGTKPDYLGNQDIVRGQLASVTKDLIEVDTWYGGRLKLPRAFVNSIQIEGRSSLFYRGPYNLAGWVQTTKDGWRFENLALVSQKASSSIARNALNADECSTSFTVQRSSESINFKVVVFSDDLENTSPKSGYELNFQRSSIYLRSGKNRDYIGSSHSIDLYQNDKVRVEIRASRKSGKVHLLINGQLIESWSDPQLGENTFGPGLHFISNDNNELRISEIEVAPWDGKVEETPRPGRRQGVFLRGRNIMPQLLDEEGVPVPKETAPQEAPEEGRMKLANGDSIKGEIKDIKDGLIELTTPLGDMILPIERMRSLNLRQADLADAKRMQGDVRATFADGSVMVFRIERIDQDHIVGTSQNFGTASFKLSAVMRIEFDVHTRLHKALMGQ